MNWNKIKFNKFITLQRGFDLPVSEMKDGEIPVLGSTGIIGYHNKAKISPPGVITGRSGTIGVIQYTDKPYWPHNTSLWVKDFKSNHPKFVYYKMKTLNFERFNGGASVPTLNRNNLDNLTVQVPDNSIQEKISSILSAYDNLIDTNRRRIQLLEEVARLLFREWFVYFRFPGHEKVKMVDGVPEGWERKTLGELADITMGQSPESRYYNEVGEGLPFHQGVADFGNRFISHRIFCTTQNRLAEDGDILCSVRAPVGKLNITLDKIVIGRGLAALRSKTGNQSLLYQQLRTHFFKEDMIGTGAIFASVTKKEFEAQKILCPPLWLVNIFEEISCPIDKQLRILFQQSQKLAQARDLLLPRLMSGVIEV